jgi:hypothetical protein
MNELQRLREIARSLLQRQDLDDEDREKLNDALMLIDVCEHSEELLVVPLDPISLLAAAEGSVLSVSRKVYGTPSC